MKKKLLCLLFVLNFAIPSLTSCLMAGGGDLFLPEGAQIGDTTINVEGGPIYEKIEINSNSDKNLLAASRALLSAVSVRCAFENQDGNTGGSAGSGVIYKLDKEKGDAYVITNYHVVYSANSTAKDGISNNINLYLYGMEYMAEGNVSYAIPATYVGGSMSYDIAVLKVRASTVLMESNAMAATFADSDKVSILETAIAIGNPGNGGLSATVGCINVDSENIDVKFDTSSGKKAVSLRVMRTDAAVNSGNSGGGLFNDKGELIGIVNAKDADMSVDNIGYAIPSNVAKAIAENAIYYNDGTVKRCLLGITVGSAKYWTEYDTETGKIQRFEKVVISELTSTSAVKDTMKVGDVINSITVDGVTHEVTRIHHVVDAMLYARVGSTVITNVTRDGVKMDIPTTITKNMLTVY